VKNYPEYPDNDDAAIKDLAEECGITDFNRAAEIVRLVRELGLYAIQSRPFVVRALRFYFPEHRGKSRAANLPAKSEK
jgi:hypothetical protein